MWFSQPVFVLVAIAIGGIYLFGKIRDGKRKNGAKIPPGPPGWPILGNALDFAKDPHLIPSFNRWAKQYGPIVKVTVMGQQMVVISSERIANDLFSKRGNIYSDRGVTPAVAVFSDGVQPALIDKTDTWRRQRKLMHSLLSITENARYEPSMEVESTYTLLDLLSTPANFDDHLARYAWGVVSRSGLGIKTHSVSDPLVLEVEEGANFAVNCFRPDKYLCNLAPWALHLPAWICSDFTVLDAFRKKLQKSILDRQELLRARMKEGNPTGCLQEEFLAHQDDYGMSDLEGGSVFNAFMGAGTRSPHNALLGFIALMVNNPEWLTRLQDELDAVVGPDRLPEFKDIPALPTVRAVVKEGIRYRSVVAEIGIPHKLSQDDVYDGYFFEKGTIFHINTSAMAMDPEMYPDGKTFNPARWLEKGYPTYKEPLTVHPNLQNFISFGFGRRACPASNFTERSLTILVARIAWACNIKSAIDPVTKLPIEVKLTYEPTANPRPHPFQAAIEARSADRTKVVKEAAVKTSQQDILV